MKLNHKEFRIGNLVEYDGRVFEIDSVSEVLPTLNTIEFGIGVVDWNNLKPIPLNEDWLVRFGFEKPAHSWNGDKFHLSEWDSYPLNWCVAMNKNGAVLVEKLKYVHQLQNLYFALTGTELTLKDK